MKKLTKFLSHLITRFLIYRYSEKYLGLLNMTEGKREVAKFADLMKNLTRWTGKEMKDLQDVVLIHVTLDIEKSMGLPLPEWSKNIYPNGELKKAVDAYHRIMSYNQELKRLNGGKISNFSKQYITLSTL